MKPEVPLDGDETDAFSKYSRRIIRWARGEVKKIKKQYNRKVRRRYKQQIKDGGYYDQRRDDKRDS